MPGPAPKPANKRARRNKDAVDQKVYVAVPINQPPLMDNVPWPQQTLDWWESLGQLPQAQEFNAVQWDHLMMIALIHADIWGNGNTRAIPDYQKAMAEYPILPASMLRLRVTALTGDELQGKNQQRENKAQVAAKKRYADLQPGQMKLVKGTG